MAHVRWVQPRVRLFAAVLLVLAPCGNATPQGAVRRLATVASLHQYPGYFHLQNVLLHGEFVESGARVVLRGGERDITVLLSDNKTAEGLVEVRGQLLDVGRLEPGDPRLASYDGAREPERWPRPGEELVLVVTGITGAQLATTPSVRGLALQPWRFEGQKVIVVGQFRGRNLFGDLPSAPGKSRYDFVLRSADTAVWVTDLRPRGRGFDLSVDARVDTGRWLQITGTVTQDRGLVTIAGTAVASATAPEALPAEEEAPSPAAPLEPADVVFSSPYEGEIDVPVTTSVRIQFSRGLDPATIAGQLRVSYIGAAAPGAPPPASLEVQHTYDAGTRAIEIKLTQPLDRFRTVRVDLLEGLKAFDGAPVRPWTLTFSAGG
ncbi:MAG: Big 5 protein [Acidobacteria bacterium]|nr:Big 5 protein [Acidobacteriota bacterium]